MESREILLLVNSTSDGIIAVNRDRIITFFNPAAERILGIERAVAVGESIEAVIPVTRLPDVIETGVAETDQQLTWREVTIVTSRYPIRDEAGAIIGAAAIFRDISELQRLAEEITNLREIRVLNEAIFQSTQDAISVVDERGRGVLVNPAYTRVTGLSQEDVLGRPCTVDIASGDSIHMKVVQTGRPVRNERLKVGRYKRDVIVDANPIIVNGRIKGSVAVIKDVSELIQLHGQLADAHATIRKLEARYTFDDVVGSEPAFVEALKRARAAAGTPATVVLRGESGTGKELFAHAIHNASERRNARFIRVNCAALSESVLESELFGYEGGAFTGARKGGRRGLFEEAHGGTIFLDEVGLMSLNTQAKLLRVLQEREVRRVGGNDAIPINVRVIAATNLDLAAEIRTGRFREDLYYRLHVVPVLIPPLRERVRDIPLLARTLLEKINSEYGRAVDGIDPAATAVLAAHPWPGNVRELENALRRAVVAMGLEETVIAADHLAELGTRSDGCSDGDHQNPIDTAVARYNDIATSEDELAPVVAAAESRHIRSVLGHCGGNRTRCAAALGISVRALQYKMKRYDIH